jgi:hypothetical protein
MQDEYSGTGTASTQINDMSSMVEHLGDFADAVEKVRNSGSPALNKPINAVARDFKGDPTIGPAAISAQVGASQWANVLNRNHALNNDQKDRMTKNLNENMPMDVAQANAKTMAQTAIRQLGPIFQGYRTGTKGKESPTQLTPKAIQGLKNMGLWDEALREGLGGQAMPPPPKVGDVVNGFQYLGGDLNKPESYKDVRPQARTQ